MKIYFVFLFAIFLIGCGKVEEKPLYPKVMNVILDHIKTTGPDKDSAQLISGLQFVSWEHREELTKVALPYLKDKNPEKVSGAIAILYCLRSYRPMNDMGSGGGPTAWDQKYKPAPFWTKLDKNMYANLEHFYAVGNDNVFRNLAIYLAASPSKQSKQELIRIINETTAKEQALICLAWYRNPEDMKTLFPFMLKNTQASQSLPYHFRNSYGKAAIPYLKKAITEAKSEKTREAAKRELKQLEKQQ
jgi:hypothetical protein